MPRPRFHRPNVADIRRETEDCRSVACAVPPALAAAYRYTPRLHLTLRTILGGEEVRRSYSLCSGLDDSELRVAITRLAGGVCSGWAQDGLRVGDALDVLTPDGRFGVPIEPGSARTLMAFAAGSAITPVMAILKTVLHPERGRFVLFYGNRSTHDTIFKDQLEDRKDGFIGRFAVFHALSRERQDGAVLSGRLDAEKVRALSRLAVPVADVAQAFICGPQPMIEGLRDVLLRLGLQPAQVHVARFSPGVGGRPKPPPITPETPAVAIARVTFEDSRDDYPVAVGETIIDAGLCAGLSLPSSCRGGMCCTRLREGRAETALNYSLEPWERQAGYGLTCQSRPLTERVVIDYDAV